MFFFGWYDTLHDFLLSSSFKVVCRIFLFFVFKLLKVWNVRNQSNWKKKHLLSHPLNSYTRAKGNLHFKLHLRETLSFKVSNPIDIHPQTSNAMPSANLPSVPCPENRSICCALPSTDHETDSDLVDKTRHKNKLSIHRLVVPQNVNKFPSNVDFRQKWISHADQMKPARSRCLGMCENDRLSFWPTNRFSLSVTVRRFVQWSPVPVDWQRLPMALCRFERILPLQLGNVIRWTIEGKWYELLSYWQTDANRW